MELFDPNQWVREGYGRELQFFATDQEVADYFRQIPRDWGPYRIWVPKVVRCGNKHKTTITGLSMDDWLSMIENHLLEFPYQYWLQAEKITGSLDNSGEFTDDLCAINGLLLIDHGASRKGKRSCSRVAIVNKIINKESGKVRSLDNQRKLFSFIAKLIKKKLKFNSLQVFQDGHVEEDKVQRMTEAAAELARSTGFFERMPGKSI